MGYSIVLKTDIIIDPADTNAIVAALPASLKHPFFTDNGKPMRTDWGYKAITDIAFPVVRSWQISGSYRQSGHVAMQMANKLADGLRKRGYIVEIDTSDFE